MNSIKLFIQYNWGKLIFITIAIMMNRLFIHTDSVDTVQKVHKVVTHGDHTFYIGYDSDSDIEFINHKSINEELNGSEILNTGESIKGKSTNGFTILSFILMLLFIIFFVISLFGEYGDWEGMKLKDIKVEAFMRKVKIIRNNGRTLHIYKNRIFLQNGRMECSNNKLYDYYKTQNINNLPIFIDEDNNDDVDNDNNSKEDKIKKIMKFLDD